MGLLTELAKSWIYYHNHYLIIWKKVIDCRAHLIKSTKPWLKSGHIASQEKRLYMLKVNFEIVLSCLCHGVLAYIQCVWLYIETIKTFLVLIFSISCDQLLV